MKKLGQTTVELAKIKESDREEFYRIAKNKEVKRFIEILYPEDMEEAKIILEMLSDDHNYIAYKIQIGKEKTVGIIMGEKKGKGVAEISCFIAKEYRHNGYCRQAIVAFRDVLKKNNFKKMQFAVNSKNEDSLKIMRGMEIPLIHESEYRIYELEI